MPATTSVFRALCLRLLSALALACTGAAASAQTGDPPGRVAVLTEIEGVALLARADEADWTDAVRNRPITNGDRLRMEEGRAELHLGTAVLHLDVRTALDVVALDLQVAQVAVTEGSVSARVRELASGENFEIDTPQLALRAAEPGEWRVDVDKVGGFTRVTVRSGTAMVYGEGGTARRLKAGQQMVFTGRELVPLAGVPAPISDAFDLWAAERHRAEDASIAARHLPREVVGYPQLDRYGAWSQDPQYGAVWYPRVTVADWVPYRYGSWEWIAPWGWTWIDDAPWGFAPFHYGRWAIIGSRWAWVPGPLGARPVYAPALVGFVGGDGWSLALGSGPGIGWYPLGPGDAWQPFFRGSPAYMHGVNRYVVPAHRHGHGHGEHFFQHRPDVVTALRANDFHRGVQVGRHWARVGHADVARARPFMPPAPSHPGRPGHRGNESDRDHGRDQLRDHGRDHVGNPGRDHVGGRDRDEHRPGLRVAPPRDPARAQPVTPSMPAITKDRNRPGSRLPLTPTAQPDSRRSESPNHWRDERRSVQGPRPFPSPSPAAAMPNAQGIPVWPRQNALPSRGEAQPRQAQPWRASGPGDQVRQSDARPAPAQHRQAQTVQERRHVDTPPQRHWAHPPARERRDERGR